MQSVEAEGGTIDEAIENALKALGTERDRVEIEILASATRGFLGIGGRKARVRAALRPSLFSGATEASPAQAEASPHGLPEPSDTPERPPENAEPGRVAAVVREMLRLMGIEAEVLVEPGDGTGEIVARLRGDGGGLLIGRGGRTLDAIEYLVNRIFARDGAEGRVVVDADGYRGRRRTALEDLALRLGAKAKRRGKPVTMSALSPRDRRIVHVALRDQPGVTTRSLGTGYYRKLVIVPEAERRR